MNKIDFEITDVDKGLKALELIAQKTKESAAELVQELTKDRLTKVKLRTIVWDSFAYPILIKDIHGKILEINTAFEIWFCVERKKIIGKKVKDFFPEPVSSLDSLSDAKLMSYESDKEHFDVSMFCNKMGKTINVRVEKSRLIEDGRIVGILNIMFE